VKKGRLRDAKRAIKNHADVTCQDADGWTPVVLAARRGDVEIVDVLVRHKDSGENRLLGTQSLDELLGDALLVAATHGQLDMVRMLLDYGADQDVQDERGIRPVMQAAKRGHVGILKALLAWNADAHAQTQTQSTALHLAARNGRLQAVQVLVDAGSETPPIVR
jgi:predicted LPLAT superfamily acyltransferase